MAVQLLPSLYDAAIASDGLCIDTPLGPVDLVAIRQVKAGWFSPLTEAELVYLARDLGPCRVTGRQALGTAEHQLRLRVAAALGITMHDLSKLISTRLRRDQREQARRTQRERGARP